MLTPVRSGAEFAADVQAQIFSKLQFLADSQHRIEGVLAEVHKWQRDTSRTMRTVTTQNPDLAFDAERSQSEPPSMFPSCNVESGDAAAQNHQFEFVSEDLEQALSFTATAATGTGIALALPDGWPASIAPREPFGPPSQSSISLYDFSHASRLSELQKLVEKSARSRRRMRWHFAVISPSSNVHMVFTACMTLVLFYNLVVVPFLLAWDMSFDGWPSTASTIAACYWTVDVLLNFISGYQHDGVAVAEPWRVARRYLRTWFVPDVVLVACDWLGVLSSLLESGDGSAGGVRMLRLVKVGRLLRIPAMLRMVKLAVVVDEHVERKLSDTYRLVLRVTATFVGTMWLNHVLACAIFAIGRAAPSDTGARWVDSMPISADEGIAILEEGVMFQYTTSFHWAVAQITLGSIEMFVCNTSERIVHIVTLLLGGLFGTTIISSLSATLVDFKLLAQNKTEKLRMLRHYLRENNVGPKVARMVQQQAAERLGNRYRLTENNVQALNLLSTSLRSELHFELCQRHVTRHPLWRLWADMDMSTVQHFCYRCVDFQFPMPRDEVFLPGVMAECCFFVVHGELTYVQETGSSAVASLTTTPVGAGGWLCEAAIWSYWMHVGTLKAETQCQLLVWHRKEFGQALQRNRVIREITVEYSKQFHRCVTSARPPSASWPNDLSVPYTEYGDLVVSMDQEAQRFIGLAALGHVAASWSWHLGRTEVGLKKLKEEVLAGKSTVIVNGNGDVERIVSVVVIRIEDGDGSVFTQLAKGEGADLVSLCRLPGAKQQRGELMGDTVKRILGELCVAESEINIFDVERRIEWRESGEYGVRTKYSRTVCHAMPRTEFAAAGAERCRMPTSPPESPRVAQAKSMARAKSMAGAKSMASMSLPKMQGREVFLYRSGHTRHYLAWLTPAELEPLGTAAGEAALLAWLAHLEPASSTPSEGACEGGASSDRSSSFDC